MIEIIETGPFNTVQDLGRPGYRNIGVTAGGAMDPLALQIANIPVSYTHLTLPTILRV